MLLTPSFTFLLYPSLLLEVLLYKACQILSSLKEDFFCLTFTTYLIDSYVNRFFTYLIDQNYVKNYSVFKTSFFLLETIFTQHFKKIHTCSAWDIVWDISRHPVSFPCGRRRDTSRSYTSCIDNSADEFLY